MPRVRDLLAAGYLPKELPAPFTSKPLSRAISGSTIPAGFGPDFDESSLNTHTLARPGMLRRPLGIPHPAAQFRLARLLVGGWKEIRRQVRKSPISLTMPVDDSSGARALAPEAGTDVGEERASRRATSRYMLLADIAECYASIYTHSLPWALHTKPVAKKRRRDPLLLGNQLDAVIRRAQDGQTVGIPVGPDSSAVLAEIVLSAVDAELNSRIGPIVGFRWYDDYELYFDTHTAADRGLAALQTSLAHYELTLNPYKTRILELPQELEERWLTELRRLSLRRSQAAERTDIIHIFDRAFALAREFSGRHVLSYALGRIESQAVEEKTLVREENWPILQRLIVQAAVNEPGALAKAIPLLRWAQDEFRFKLDRALLSRALDVIAGEWSARGVASEVAAALWAAIALRARIHRKAAIAVSGMSDDAVALLALHARDKGVIAKGLDTSTWQGWMTKEGLLGDHWLASYEARTKRWLRSTGGGDHRTSLREFDTLATKGVEFYDLAAKVPEPSAAPRVRLAPLPPGIAGYV